jgi:hypothetical protein
MHPPHFSFHGHPIGWILEHTFTALTLGRLLGNAPSPFFISRSSNWMDFRTYFYSSQLGEVSWGPGTQWQKKSLMFHIPTIHGGRACGYWLTMAVTDHSQVYLARFGYTPKMKVKN